MSHIYNALASSADKNKFIKQFPTNLLHYFYVQRLNQSNCCCNHLLCIIRAFHCQRVFLLLPLPAIGFTHSQSSQGFPLNYVRIKSNNKAVALLLHVARCLLSYLCCMSWKNANISRLEGKFILRLQGAWSAVGSLRASSQLVFGKSHCCAISHLPLLLLCQQLLRSADLVCILQL